MLRTLMLLLLAGLLTESSMAGGPWPRARNSGYAQLGFTYVGYNKFFAHDGKVTSLRRNITDLTAQVLVEYGLTDRLTFSAVLPFKYAASGSRILNSDSLYFRDTVPSGSIFGMNTLLLGFKYNIIHKKVLLSAGLDGEANVAKYDSLTALRTGPGTFVIHPYLSVGTSFGKFYTMLDAGYRLRLKNYSDQVDFNFEFGFSWNRKTYFIATVAGRLSMNDGSYDNNVTTDSPFGRDLHTSINPNGQQYVGYGLKFIQKIEKVHLNAGIYFGTGKMVAAAPSYNLGIAYEW